jgi:hypothetical protein
MNISIEEFEEDRRVALESLDEETIRVFLAKYHMPVPDNPDTFWCTVHKHITSIPELPLELRQYSKAWLHARGWRSLEGWRIPDEELDALADQSDGDV